MAKTINLTITGRKRLCLGGWGGGGFFIFFEGKLFLKTPVFWYFLRGVKKKESILTHPTKIEKERGSF